MPKHWNDIIPVGGSLANEQQVCSVNKLTPTFQKLPDFYSFIWSFLMSVINVQTLLSFTVFRVKCCETRPWHCSAIVWCCVHSSKSLLKDIWFLAVLVFTVHSNQQRFGHGWFWMVIDMANWNLTILIIKCVFPGFPFTLRVPETDVGTY